MSHLEILEEEKQWLSRILKFRELFDTSCDIRNITSTDSLIKKITEENKGTGTINLKRDLFEKGIHPPKLPEKSDSVYANFIRKNNLPIEERLLLILSLVVHIDNLFFEEKKLYNTHPGTNEIHKGYVTGAMFPKNLPTGLTYLYFLGGTNVEVKAEMYNKIYERQLHLLSHNIVDFTDSHPSEPFLSGPLFIVKDYIISFISNIEK